jgi:hypothetical protein
MSTTTSARPRVVGGGRYVCFSDRPRSVAPWETQAFPQLFDEPARNARIPKCLPHLLLDTDISIYMDGAFRPLAPLDHAAALLGDADIAMFAHPGGHKSYHDERNFYQQIHGYVPADVEATYQRFVADDVPVTGQFWAGGLVIRRHNAAVERFNERWFRGYIGGTYNDQFALYRAVVESGVRVATIAGVATMDTRYFGYCLHANSGCGDNPQHEADNARWAARIQRIRELSAVA